MNKPGGIFNFNAATRTVSCAAVIGGVFLIALGAIIDKENLWPIGIGIILFGVISVVIMTLIIKS